MPKRQRDVDWAKALDLEAALVALHYELQGDWYRDPWGWPELDWAATEGTDLVIERLNQWAARRVAKVDVPKENFGTRPAIVLDPIDRLIYQALVDRHSVKLIGGLPPWVFGWRLKAPAPRPGEWSHNDLQYAAFRDVLSQAATFSTTALRTDIVSCFASIEVQPLCEMVETRSGSDRTTERLNDLIRGWEKVAGRSGLAQRSAASAALANMYLEPVDDVLHGHEKRRSSSGGQPRGILRTLISIPRVARWMDDIWVFGHDAGKLRVIQLELQDVLRSIGLELNHAKTEVLEGPEVQEEVRLVQHSAIDEALHDEEPNPQPLLELVEELLDQPSKADRTSVKFVTRRMREHKLFGPVPEFAGRAHEMPHAADALARLFRDSKHWRVLPHWYVDYARSPWGTVKWSVAQLGTAFPSKVNSQAVHRTIRPVENYFLELLEHDSPLPLLALAAQRLASWNRNDARASFRAAATASDDPHVRRVVALASTNAGEDRAVIRKMLREFEENQVTLRMLEDRSFHVQVKSDFDGS